jgi:pyridoxine 4-dehydrogenase
VRAASEADAVEQADNRTAVVCSDARRDVEGAHRLDQIRSGYARAEEHDVPRAGERGARDDDAERATLAQPERKVLALARVIGNQVGRIDVELVCVGEGRLEQMVADRGSAKTLLRRAVALGVNFIDTADSYGPGTSERLIADALLPYPDDLVIATKGGLVRDGPSTDLWPEDGRPEHLRAACEGSLARLRLERIDLYQLHRPDPKVPLEESLGALADLQAEGKIRHIGLSNVSLTELERAQAVVRVVSVQNRYSLVARQPEDVLDACASQQLAFIAWQPLGVGSLGRPGGPLARMASRLGASVPQVALAWLLHRSPLMLPIPGTFSIEHLEENLAAARLRLTGYDPSPARSER